MERLKVPTAGRRSCDLAYSQVCVCAVNSARDRSSVRVCCAYAARVAGSSRIEVCVWRVRVQVQMNISLNMLACCVYIAVYMIVVAKRVRSPQSEG